MYIIICFILSIFIVSATETPDQIPLTKKTHRTEKYDDLSEFWPQLKKVKQEFPQVPSKLSREEIFEEHTFLQEIPYQGWKIYVSAALESMNIIKNQVQPYLEMAKTNYKIIKTYEAYEQFNLYDEEAGKYITIYPRDQDEALKISLDLDNLLNSLPTTHFMKLPYCLSLGQSGGLWTRYGRFKYGFPMKDGCVLVVSKKDQFLNCPTSADFRKKLIGYNRKFQPDDRTLIFPEFMGFDWLPFGDLSRIFPKNELLF